MSVLDFEEFLMRAECEGGSSILACLENESGITLLPRQASQGVLTLPALSESQPLVESNNVS